MAMVNAPTSVPSSAIACATSAISRTRIGQTQVNIKPSRSTTANVLSARDAA